jgi:ATP-dependent RNA helicase DDX51/DBP6
MISCETTHKPLMLFHLVHNHGVTNALVFTKSTESTTRLVRLFEFFEKAWAAETRSHQPVMARAYSSDLGVAERKSILEKFKAQEIQMYGLWLSENLLYLSTKHRLVCSDLISRGIDISHVSHVVSYDVPVDMLKYVHRVGRTARAGRTGDAWTLVESQEVNLAVESILALALIFDVIQALYFKSMLKSADHLEQVKRMRVSDVALAPLLPHYEVGINLLLNRRFD